MIYFRHCLIHLLLSCISSATHVDPQPSVPEVSSGRNTYSNNSNPLMSFGTNKKANPNVIQKLMADGFIKSVEKLYIESGYEGEDHVKGKSQRKGERCSGVFGRRRKKRCSGVFGCSRGKICSRVFGCSRGKRCSGVFGCGREKRRKRAEYSLFYDLQDHQVKRRAQLKPRLTARGNICTGNGLEGIPTEATTSSSKDISHSESLEHLYDGKRSCDPCDCPCGCMCRPLGCHQQAVVAGTKSSACACPCGCGCIHSPPSLP